MKVKRVESATKGHKPNLTALAMNEFSKPSSKNQQRQSSSNSLHGGVSVTVMLPNSWLESHAKFTLKKRTGESTGTT